MGHRRADLSRQPPSRGGIGGRQPAPPDPYRKLRRWALGGKGSAAGKREDGCSRLSPKWTGHRGSRSDGTSTAPPVTDPTLESLEGAARSGDQASLRTLVRRTYRRIYRWALGRTGDPDDAEDVTQEVLIRMHRHLDSWEGRGSIETWLFRITMNEATSLDRKRARWKAEGTDPTRAPPRGSGELRDAESRRALERVQSRRVLDLVEAFLTELPRAQRQVFQLVDLEGLRPVEVAARMGLSASTVRVHLHRARAGLRRRILEEHPHLPDGYERRERER
jgi:RNA polymerase sigma-70 factor, ECF subfamily